MAKEEQATLSPPDEGETVLAVNGQGGELTEFRGFDSDEMEGLTVSFDRIKVPAGGSTAFQIPNPDDPDNPINVPKIEAVIIDHYPVKAFYLSSFSGSNNPPDCVARDGKHGIANEDAMQHGAGGECKLCPMNKWGSDLAGGRGKACKDMRRIYFLRPGEPWPNLLVLPPTSIQNFGDYLGKAIIGRGLQSVQVVTEMTLKQVKNQGGIAYSQVQFRRARVLTNEEAEPYGLASLQLHEQTRRFQDYTDEEVGAELSED